MVRATGSVASRSRRKRVLKQAKDSGEIERDTFVKAGPLLCGLWLLTTCTEKIVKVIFEAFGSLV